MNTLGEKTKKWMVKMKRLLIDYNPLYVRVAMTENSELAEFYIERSSVLGIVGNIYKGKVMNVLSGMKAAFVNIGLEKNGFLYVGESLVDITALAKKKKTVATLNISAGDMIMCQVVKDQFGDKGARLSMEITLAGRMLVLVPNSTFVGVSRKINDPVRRSYLEEFVKDSSQPNTGFIVRTSANKASDTEILQEMEELESIWKTVQENYQKANEGEIIFKEVDLISRAIRDILTDDIDSILVNDEQIYKELEGKVNNAELVLYSGEENLLTHYNLERSIEKLCDREVKLKNGAYIVIDKTEALTVIDVNTGKFVGGKDLEDTVYKTNLQAAAEIAKQLRLRNIGGIIIIDFIDMTNPVHKENVIEALKDALKQDKMKTTVVSMTSLGLVELTRKKTRLPVDTYFLRDCPYCRQGHLLSHESNIIRLRERISKEFMSSRPQSILVEVNSELFDKIFETRILTRECRTVWKGKRIYILKNDTLHIENFIITPDNSKILTLPDTARLLY
ncbi:MAG TPA: Rne/Rng family ribonuclease [Clostridia bacterium]|nr:Rne/Rng family ribonuclease [Clostridia bacterium]